MLPSVLHCKHNDEQECFSENSKPMLSLLDNLHKAHRASLNKPSSSVCQWEWQKPHREVEMVVITLQNEWWINKKFKPKQTSRSSVENI